MESGGTVPVHAVIYGYLQLLDLLYMLQFVVLMHFIPPASVVTHLTGFIIEICRLYSGISTRHRPGTLTYNSIQDIQRVGLR